MVRRFVVFTIVEEALVMCLMVWSYSTYATSTDPWSRATVMAALFIGLAASNAAVFLQCRKSPWGSLRLSRRLCRVGAAIVSTFAIFLAVFACLSLAFDLDFVALLKLSSMAALGIGAWALVGSELSRESVVEVVAIRSGECDECPESAAPTLRKVVDLIEEEADRAWLRQPRVLRKMLDSACLGDGKYSTEEVVSYLRGAIGEAGGDGGVAVTDVVRWVDSLFADVLVADISQRIDDWDENIGEITELLGIAERRLGEEPSSSAVDGPALGGSGIRGLGNRALNQRIQAYACIADSIAGDEDGFCSKLEDALRNVESNIDVILSQDEPAALAMIESTVGWDSYDPHARFWTAPLAIPAHAAEAIGRERELLETYERYARFLKEHSCGTNALGGILMDAQITISRLQGNPIWGNTRICLPDFDMQRDSL